MGCQALMKIFLVVFNIIFFLVGASTLAVGIWVKVDKQHLLDLTKDVSGADLNQTDIPSLLENAVIVLIVAGAFIFLLGFLGCCGAIKSKSAVGKLFLKIYAAVVLIILILEIAGVAVVWLFFDKVESKLQTFLDKSLQKRYNGTFKVLSAGGFSYSSNGDPITLAWDIVQLQFGCCGRANGSDYTDTSIYWDAFRTIVLADGTTTDDLTVPPTCCSVSGGSKALIADLKKVSSSEFTLDNDNCPYLPVDTSVPGCYDEIKNVIKSNSVLFIAIGGSTVFLELMCVLFACCLAKRDNDEVEDMKR